MTNEPKDKSLFQLGAVIGSLAIVGLMIYGSWLPYRKSQAYVTAARPAADKTLSDYLTLMDKAILAPSPIGKPELVRNLATTVASLMQETRIPNDVKKQMVAHLEEIYAPIIARGKGMSYGQDLYVLAVVNQRAFFALQDPAYFLAARRYAEEEYARDPKRPQTLYLLLTLYQMEGDKARVEEFAKTILSYWPDDKQVPVQVDAFLKRIKASST
jgi:hypothetical protein